MNNLSNINEFTVTQLNKSIKNLIEGSFETVKVTGEISEVKSHASGHVYFVLKDENETISSICWRSKVPNLSVKIDDGIFVCVTGKVTTYSPQSKYQLIVEKINYKGEGSLLKILEDRKKKLLEHGLFDKKFKKRLPKFPKRIGIITSESGAVIKDIVHRLSDRFPIEIVLFPVKVQGKECLESILQALSFFQQEFEKNSLLVPDIVVLARGGGSFEDLMPFNDESLVRKIFAFEIPFVSAVGHETDITLCDFVADLRAPTPSAAAELIVPDRKEILIRLKDKEKFLKKLISQIMQNNQIKIKLLESKFPQLLDMTNRYFQDLDILGHKFINLLQNILVNNSLKFNETKKRLSLDVLTAELKFLQEKLFGLNDKIKKEIFFLFEKRKNELVGKKRMFGILSYKKTLMRGFSVVRSKGKIISDDKSIDTGEKLEIEFYKSKIEVEKT